MREPWGTSSVQGTINPLLTEISSLVPDWEESSFIFKWGRKFSLSSSLLRELRCSEINWQLYMASTRCAVSNSLTCGIKIWCWSTSYQWSQCLWGSGLGISAESSQVSPLWARVEGHGPGPLGDKLHDSPDTALCSQPYSVLSHLFTLSGFAPQRPQEQQPQSSISA